jgi:SCY1-like protein 2
MDVLQKRIRPLNCFIYYHDYSQKSFSFIAKLTQNSFPSYKTHSHPQVPPELAPILQSMLAENPQNRCNIGTFLASDFFQDIYIKALRFLETLNEKDDAQKVQFLKGFASLLQRPDSPLKGDVRLTREKILPQLAKSLTHPPLYSFVLTNILICINPAAGKVGAGQATDKVHWQVRRRR